MERIALLRGLDKFGQYAHTERVGQPHDGGYDLFVVLMGIHPLNQRAVQLDEVEEVVLEIGDRGLSRLPDMICP